MEVHSPAILSEELEVDTSHFLSIGECYLVNVLTHLCHGDAVVERRAPVGVVHSSRGLSDVGADGPNGLVAGECARSLIGAREYLHVVECRHQQDGVVA